MTTIQDGADSADRRARIERVLADYPQLGDERIAELVHWFRKEASALDVAMVASNPDVAATYRQFRTDHLDRLSGNDILRGLLFASIISAIVLAIIWRAL